MLQLIEKAHRMWARRLLTHEFYLPKNHSRNYEDTAHMNCVLETCPNFQNNGSDCPNFHHQRGMLPFHTRKSIASSMTGYTLHNCSHGVLETWWTRMDVVRWRQLETAAQSWKTDRGPSLYRHHGIRQALLWQHLDQKQVNQQKKWTDWRLLEAELQRRGRAAGIKAVISQREGGGEPGGVATTVGEVV